MKKAIFGLTIAVMTVSWAHAMEGMDMKEGHCAQMEKQAAEAFEYGDGYPNVLKKHAQAMLEHAKACESENMRKASAADHVKEAIKHEQEAIEETNAGHADLALKHSEKALEHAKEANQ